MSAKWLGVELHRIFLGEMEGDHFRYLGPRPLGVSGSRRERG